MVIWEKHCPKCGGLLDEKGSCTKCGFSIITGISGNTYIVSSSTWTSPSFTHLADAFGNNVNDEKQEADLKSQPYLDDDTLNDYIKWGFLIKISDNKYKLTESGKELVKKNRGKRGKL